jgi:hypothetical protein
LIKSDKNNSRSLFYSHKRSDYTLINNPFSELLINLLNGTVFLVIVGSFEVKVVLILTLSCALLRKRIVNNDSISYIVKILDQQMEGVYSKIGSCIDLHGYLYYPVDKTIFRCLDAL